MRGEVIDKIRQLAEIHDNFSPRFMRWSRLRFHGELIHEVEYYHLNDQDLLEFYGMIVIQCFKQM